jgi:inner membrane transporter RhtA
MHRFTAAQWRAVVPYGVTIGVMNLLFYQALARIPLGLAVTLEFVGPLAVAIVGSRRALDAVWIVLAAIGIALITPWQAGSAIDRVRRRARADRRLPRHRPWRRVAVVDRATRSRQMSIAR